MLVKAAPSTIRTQLLVPKPLHYIKEPGTEGRMDVDTFGKRLKERERKRKKHY